MPDKNSQDGKLDKKEADLWNKMYGGVTAAPQKPSHYKPLNELTGTAPKSGQLKAQAAVPHHLSSGKSFFNKTKGLFLGKKFIITSCAVIAILLLGGYFFFQNNGLYTIKSWFIKPAPYTKNPAMQNVPLGSVVK